MDSLVLSFDYELNIYKSIINAIPSSIKTTDGASLKDYIYKKIFSVSESFWDLSLTSLSGISFDIAIISLENDILTINKIAERSLTICSCDGVIDPPMALVALYNNIFHAGDTLKANILLMTEVCNNFRVRVGKEFLKDEYGICKYKTVVTGAGHKFIEGDLITNDKDGEEKRYHFKLDYYILP